MDTDFSQFLLFKKWLTGLLFYFSSTSFIVSTFVYLAVWFPLVSSHHSRLLVQILFYFHFSTNFLHVNSIFYSSFSLHVTSFPLPIKFFRFYILLCFSSIFLQPLSWLPLLCFVHLHILLLPGSLLPFSSWCSPSLHPLCLYPTRTCLYSTCTVWKCLRKAQEGSCSYHVCLQWVWRQSTAQGMAGSFP